jgi:hypothetical protein
MSIGNVHGPAATPLWPKPAVRSGVGEAAEGGATVGDRAGAAAGSPAGGGRVAIPARTPAAATAVGLALPGDISSTAPPGTDPALWKVLTAEERAFFARAQVMGRLTYGPGSPGSLQAAPEALVRGVRLDVRV